MTVEKYDFKCDMCGLCCQRVGTSELYRLLDRGDGVCKYYEDLTHKCVIYEERPLFCNIEKYYDKYLKDVISKEEFFRLNYIVCENFKKNQSGGNYE